MHFSKVTTWPDVLCILLCDRAQKMSPHQISALNLCKRFRDMSWTRLQLTHQLFFQTQSIRKAKKSFQKCKNNVDWFDFRWFSFPQNSFTDEGSWLDKTFAVQFFYIRGPQKFDEKFPSWFDVYLKLNDKSNGRFLQILLTKPAF